MSNVPPLSIPSSQRYQRSLPLVLPSWCSKALLALGILWTRWFQRVRCQSYPLLALALALSLQFSSAKSILCRQKDACIMLESRGRHPCRRFDISRRLTKTAGCLPRLCSNIASRDKYFKITPPPRQPLQHLTVLRCGLFVVYPHHWHKEILQKVTLSMKFIRITPHHFHTTSGAKFSSGSNFVHEPRTTMTRSTFRLCFNDICCIS